MSSNILMTKHNVDFRSRLRLRANRSDSRVERAGYSLLEILVVLAIIAMIVAVVGPRLFSQLDRAKTRTASLQIRSLEAALETMRLDIGRLPTTAEGLNLLVAADPATVNGWYGPYLSEKLPSDPWGRPYIYEAPTASTGAPTTPGADGALQGPAGEIKPKVTSYGADGTPGGDGINADVTSATR
jgi:general secretion pathway protein G